MDQNVSDILHPKNPESLTISPPPPMEDLEAFPRFPNSSYHSVRFPFYGVTRKQGSTVTGVKASVLSFLDDVKAFDTVFLLKDPVTQGLVYLGIQIPG